MGAAPDGEKKEKKAKKDKKDKKDKKPEQASGVADAMGAAPGGETTEKKSKKDKKSDKKEKKDKKRKADDIAHPEQAAQDEALEPEQPAPTDIIEEEMQGMELENLIDEIAGADEPSSRPHWDGADDEGHGDAGVFQDFQEEGGEVIDDFMGDLEANVEDDQDPTHDPIYTQPQEMYMDVPVVTPPFEKAKKRKTVQLEDQYAAQDDDATLTSKLGSVMEALKIKRALQITERESQPFVEEFVKEMIEAAEKDLRQYKANCLTPLKHKMNLLNKAEAIMIKFVFAELFVAYGGCRALAMWLSSLPDGQLPNAHLRTTLLTVMLRLPISKEALANCKEPALGEVVAKLMNNPIETVANRKNAALLVQKWVKQVLVNPASAEAGDEGEGGEGVPMLPRKPAETMESFLQLEETSFLRLHPSIPVREGKVYHIHPPTTAVPQKRERYVQDCNRYKLNEVLKVFNRPNKKQWKPYEVSIAGRQLNQL